VNSSVFNDDIQICVGLDVAVVHNIVGNALVIKFRVPINAFQMCVCCLFSL